MGNGAWGIGHRELGIETNNSQQSTVNSQQLTVNCQQLTVHYLQRVATLVKYSG
ncbi:hypothetical protein [Tychonema bourrellyi]|uniref:hypothetical protein n=1 Tax=Tychonema bourrellyi TaxID=54313 RepID=UPI0015D4D82A|nr:hypothetical protein [Tychonema bourrellyi]